MGDANEFSMTPQFLRVSSPEGRKMFFEILDDPKLSKSKLEEEIYAWAAGQGGKVLVSFSCFRLISLASFLGLSSKIRRGKQAYITLVNLNPIGNLLTQTDAAHLLSTVTLRYISLLLHDDIDIRKYFGILNI
ncbi:unnamed protein product [Toxocara canis]|uniref:STAS domain-containing protein n=1 Tax=Toxocara canis TaxID=6265 RepID=A0A183VAG5_TOXCA|nr:unnamed protein product [Toxocara canis]